MSIPNPNYKIPGESSTELNFPGSTENPENAGAVSDTLRSEGKITESKESAGVAAAEGLSSDLSEREKQLALGAIIGNPDTAGKIMQASVDGKDPKKTIAEIYNSADLTPHQVLEKNEDPSNIVEGLYGNPTSEIK